MKSKIGKRVALFFGIAVILTGLAIIAAYRFQGMFFMMFPWAETAVESVAQKAGYDFICYDLHGGWKCHFELIPLPANPATVKTFELFQCHSNDECVATRHNGCALKGLLPALSEGAATCVCLTGPVVFGCMTQNQAAHIKQ